MLLGRDQLYFGIVELLAFLLSLVLGVLEASLSAHSLLFLRGQLRGQHLVLLLRCTQGFACLGAKVSLDPGFIASFFHLLLSHEDLLDDLHKNNKGILC